VEALVPIHSCFISHSIKLRGVHYQQSLSRCITCQDVYVQQSQAAKRLLQ